MTGFPVDIAEKIVTGPAVADLEGDGVFDIAVTTWGEHIYAIDAAGNVKEGFPFVASRRFNAPPVIADFDGDGDLDIVSASAFDDTIAVYTNDGADNPTFATEDISTKGSALTSTLPLLLLSSVLTTISKEPGETSTP